MEAVRCNDLFPDPAILSGIPAYRKSRKLEDLVIKPGVLCDVFSVTEVPVYYYTEVSETKSATRYLVLFSVGCQSIRLADGTTMAPKQEDTTRITGTSHCVAGTEWIDRVRARFGLETILEMGRLVDRLCLLPEGSAGPFV